MTMEIDRSLGMARFLEWGDANTKGTMILSVFSQGFMVLLQIRRGGSLGRVGGHKRVVGAIMVCNKGFQHC